MIRSIYISLILFLTTSHSFSQELSANLDDKQLLIGESTVLTLKVKTDKSDSINYREQRKEIDAYLYSGSSIVNAKKVKFDVLQPFWDTTFLNQNEQVWLGKYTVTIWDSGTFVIPGQPISIDDSVYYFNDVKIYYNLVPKIKDVAFYDIKENFADIPEDGFTITAFLRKNWWWIAIILIGSVVYYFYRLNKKADVLGKPERSISLKDKTLIAIEALEKERLWEKDRLKEHFVELSYILRTYLTYRYDISLLEKTTYQAKILLLQKGLDEDTVNTIIRILSSSDLVKFAKSKPDALEILKVSTKAKQVVAETSPIELEDVE